MDREDLIWLSGFLEGEGSFGCYKSGVGGNHSANSLVVQASSTDRDVIDRVAKLFGKTTLQVGASNRKRQAHHKQQYGVRLNGMPAALLMLKLLPLMGTRRREQIKRALLLYPKFIEISRTWTISATAAS
jgi:hypothetical protein